MKIEVALDVDVCIEGKNVVLYVSDGHDISCEREFSIYDLVHDYMSAYATPDGVFKFTEDDKADIQALISELDDAMAFAQETLEPEEA